MAYRALAVLGPVLASVVAAQSSRVISPHHPAVPQDGVAFVENRGQWDGRALFRADTGPMTTWLTARGWTFTVETDDRPEPQPGDGLHGTMPGWTLHGVAMRMTFENALAAAPPRGEQQLPGVRSYFLGNDPRRWTTGVPAHARAVYEDLYPGVDLVVRGQDGHLEYDLCLAPGAALQAITVRCEGQSTLHLADDGTLVLETPLGPVLQPPPVAWQIAPDGRRVPVACRFVVLDGQRFGFAAPQRRADRPLVIDPGLLWSRLFGGSGHDVPAEDGHSVVVAQNGDLLVCGGTRSTDFPATLGAYQQTYGGCQGPYCQNFGDAFVMRLTPDASQLVWCTYLGGPDGENALAVEELTTDHVLVVGWTDSPAFPVTPGVFQPQLRGASDAFVVRLDWDAQQQRQSLSWSTFLGGHHDEVAYDVALDPAGSILVLGFTESTSFPTTPGAFQTTLNGGVDAFVSLIAPAATQLVRSTYIGGSADEQPQTMAVDAAGHVVFNGRTYSSDFPTQNAFDAVFDGPTDAFVSRLDGTLSNLTWSTYLGGTGTEWCIPLALGPTGRVFVAGWTDATDFPTTSGAYQTTFGGGTNQGDGYVTCLDPLQTGAAQLVWSTYVGRTGDDIFEGLAIEGSGIVTVAGGTSSGIYPWTPGTYDRSFNGGGWDAVVTRLDPAKQGAAQLVYSTYLGGSSNEWAMALALDATGGAIVTGRTFSPNFPATIGSYGGGGDGFLTALDMLPIGVTRYGWSTPACAWPIYMSVNSMPAPGNLTFAVHATGAAPQTPGALLFSTPDLSGFAFANLQLFFQFGPLLTGPTVSTNPLGYTELPIPIPSSVSLPTGLGFQWVFLTKPPCGGTGALSSSEALQF